MKYRLIGLDLDGTLLSPDNSVSRENIAAVRDAQDAGVLVVPCTGRGWCESVRPLSPVANLSVGVFNTGAAVVDMASGEAIELAALEPHVALELIEYLRPLPEAVLVYMDRGAAGCDYMVTGDGELTDNTRKWFEYNELVIRENRHPSADDLHHALRVGLVARGNKAFEVEQEVAERFNGRVSVHAFAGVPTARAEDRLYIAEIFSKDVNKWRGLQYLADQHGIAHDQVAAVGDEVNDLAMLESAGLGIAMGNAVQQAVDVAKHTTLSNEEHGVAHAIRQMLDGRW